MRSRVLKLILPLVVILEVFLVWSGMISLGSAVLVVICIEAFIFALATGGLLLARHRYHSDRSLGLDRWTALEDALSQIMPHKAVRLLLHEPRIFIALGQWIFRRAKLEHNDFGYHRRSVMRALLPMMIVVAPVELAVLHLLLHIFSAWIWLHFALLALEIYGISWLFGFYASLVTLPHRLEKEGLCFHYGAFVEGFVPYAGIEEVMLQERKPPKAQDGLHRVPSEEALYLAVGGRTNITLHLRSPRSARGFFNDSPPARSLYLAADEPHELTRRLRSLIPEPSISKD